MARLLYGIAEAAWLVLLVALPAAINPSGGMVVEPVKASLLRYLAAVAGMTWACGRLLGAGEGRGTVLGPTGQASLAWLGAISLSTLLSLNPAVSFFGSYERGMGLLSLAAGPLLLLTGAQLFADARRRERALTALVLGAVVPCLYALAQYLGRDPLRWTGVQGLLSSLGSPTFLAGYLVLVTPFALYRTILAGLSLSSGGGGLRAAWYALHLGLLLLAMAVIVLSAIRGALLGLVVAVATYALLMTRGTPGRRFLAVVAVGLLVGVTLTLVSLSSGNTPRVLQRFLDVALPTGSGQVRLTVWSAALPLPLQAPQRALLGFGPEMQGTVFEQSRSIVETSTNERWDRAHNLLIDTWVTAGALGVGTLVLVLGTAARRLWRKVNSAATWQESLLPAAVLAVLAGHLVEQLFSFQSVVTGAWFWVALALGSSLDPADTAKLPPRPARGARLGLAGLAAAFAVLSLPVLAAPAVADTLHGAALQAQRLGALRAAAQAAEQAAAWAPWEERLPRLAGVSWQALALRRQGAAADELFGRAEEQFVEAIRRNPFDPYAHLRLARHALAWAARSSDPDRQVRLAEEAAQACARALALGPFRPVIRQSCAAGEDPP